MAYESLPHAVPGLALRGLALVMRIDEIAATAVDVDGKAEVVEAARGEAAVA